MQCNALGRAPKLSLPRHSARTAVPRRRRNSVAAVAWGSMFVLLPQVWLALISCKVMRSAQEQPGVSSSRRQCWPGVQAALCTRSFLPLSSYVAGLPGWIRIGIFEPLPAWLTLLLYVCLPHPTPQFTCHTHCHTYCHAQRLNTSLKSLNQRHPSPTQLPCHTNRQPRATTPSRRRRGSTCKDHRRRSSRCVPISRPRMHF